MTEPRGNYDQNISPPFSDERNITVGQARLIWADRWAYRPEGWVLPGGLRTTDRAEAMWVAQEMDKLMSGV